MNLLHLDASALGAGSVTRTLGAAVVAQWQAAVPGLRVDYRDLDADPLPHLTASVRGGEVTAAAAAGWSPPSTLGVRGGRGSAARSREWPFPRDDHRDTSHR